MHNTEPSPPTVSSSEIELLEAAYRGFNSRDTDAVLSRMSGDVTWPRAFKGGFVRGHQQVREYWAEQWTEIDGRVEPVSFQQEADGRILVRVHQVVRDLDGKVLADEHTGHRFTLAGGLIQAMEVVPDENA